MKKKPEIPAPFAGIQPAPRRIKKRSLFDKEIAWAALKRSLLMFRPDIQWKNPVMFAVEMGAFLILVYLLKLVFQEESAKFGYFLALDIWLFLTVFFANFATAVAEVRGKAQADSLKKTRRKLLAHRINHSGSVEVVSSTALSHGDRVIVQAGELIPADGEVVEGAAYVDESVITGESAPALREAGGDRSGVTASTLVLSDRIIVQVTNGKGHSFLDRMIALVEGAMRQRSPNELALSVLLSALTLIFLIVVIPLWAISYHAELYMEHYLGSTKESLGTDVPTLIALLVCLAPTTIGALLSAIGIAGMNRALRANIVANSGKAVELAGDIDVVLIDKTGTITEGNRQARDFLPLAGYTKENLIDLAALASISDLTPEGRSIQKILKKTISAPKDAQFIPFSAKTRLSGIDLPDGRKIRKGAPSAILEFAGKEMTREIDQLIDTIASKGATPLLVAEDDKIIGLIDLEDKLKHGIKEKFAHLKKMGLKIVMLTGDNPKTAAAIVKEAGLHEFLARETPEAKLAYIKKEQAEGKLVAMMGDGTNDAPALAQADIGLAMNAGTMAAKEAANMVDLDSDPSKLLKVIEIGKQLLITRGALTTFSITNDVAKYFAIIPAMTATTLPWLKAIDVMHLHSPTSAILSAVIFNALIIPALIPLALEGVRYHAIGASALLRKNLLIWGVGGLIIPFIGIKLIDLAMVYLKLVDW